MNIGLNDLNLHMRSESTGQGALVAVNLNMRREHWIKRFEPTHAQREHLANCSGGWWLVAGSWRLAAGGWQLADGLAAAGRPAAGSWPAAGRQLASRPASRLAGWLPGSWLPASRLAGWLAGQQLAAGWQTHALRLVADGWWLAAGGWLWRKIVFTQDRFHSREITTFFPKCRLALALSSRLVLEVRALLSESPAKAMRLSRVLSKPRHEDGPIQQEGT